MHVQGITSKISLEDHLKAIFGYNSFRDCQKEIVTSLINHKDVLAILPTGAGKSICYQLPAMLMPGLAVVISPLISLMQDQVVGLVKSGIPAAFLNSSLHFQDILSVINNLTDYKLLYIAPERLTDQNFIERLKQTSVSFFAIDEAHCISQWGHSFRPEYRQLSILKSHFPNSAIIALTATATKEVEQDIASQLAMKDPHIVKASFDRPNLTLRVNGKIDALSQLKSFLEKHPNKPGIIYAATRKTVDATYFHLQQAGFKVGRYHAGLSDEDRSTAQHDFIYGDVNLMVATVAFGMGIHKPDIRFIVHMDMPRSIEQYYQEIGRAGRDGLASECLLLFSYQDLAIYHSFLEDITDKELKKSTKFKTDKMYALCNSMICRRRQLLEYFGEKSSFERCNNCDNCLDAMDTVDETVTAQKILSCVYKIQQRFGIKHVIDVLRGSQNKQVLARGHDKQSTYGLMKNCSEAELRYYIDELLKLGYLQISGGEYPLLQWTDNSRSVISGLNKVLMRKRQWREQKVVVAGQFDGDLLSKLIKYRLKLARDSEVPAFVIFGDKTLIEMATTYPKTQSEFLEVNGVGQIKWDRYGVGFLQIINEHCAEKSKG
jgi:ATP-dependent DNA helicase RecQ